MNTGTVAKGVAFHQHRQTWGWLLAGSKVWYVAAPGTLQFQPHRHVEEAKLQSAGVQRCVQEEGEIVFLPRDWWHATFNKADWNLAIGGQGEISSRAYEAVRGADAAKIRKLPKEDLQWVFTNLDLVLLCVIGRGAKQSKEVKTFARIMLHHTAIALHVLSPLGRRSKASCSRL